jgi:hypothetical protein
MRGNGPDYTGTFRLTGNLRWWYQRVGDQQRTILQQEWYDQRTGLIDWREVPHVEPDDE